MLLATIAPHSSSKTASYCWVAYWLFAGTVFDIVHLEPYQI